MRQNQGRGFIYLILWFLPVLLIPQACTRSLPTVTPPIVSTATPVPDGCPIVATLNFTGNLNSAQRADQPGGIMDMNQLPLNIDSSNLGFVNGAKIQFVAYGSSGFAIHQVADFTTPADTTGPVAQLTTPLLNGGWLWSGMGSQLFTWDQPTPLPPACTCVKTVRDSGGNSRQITFQFYQVNDLGPAGINPTAPRQAAWAWYAFETTGGAAPSHTNLLGGSNIVEGDPTLSCSNDHGHPGTAYAGDLIFFNSDGSLAGEGGLAGPPSPAGPPNYQVHPSVYLPVFNGAAISRIYLNFGTAGMLGFGLKDGLTGNAAPSVVN